MNRLNPMERYMRGPDGDHRSEDGQAERRNPAEDPGVRTRLRDAGLRPTRQRVALADILYSRGHRHVSAEDLHVEALAARVPVSLATVYNTLHQFTEAGLLREVAVEGTRTYFDTNTGEHHHFYVEGENRIFDIADESLRLDALPAAPDGMEIVRVDVVVRLRPKARTQS